MTDDFDKLFQSFEEPKAQPKEPAKKPFTPYKKSYPAKVGGVTDQDRQASIERQNALTNAANLFKADCVRLVNDKDFSSAITSAIKKVAKELLNFHKEV